VPGYGATMSRILVTGATGFVGRALLPALTSARHHVRAATRSPAKAPPMAGVEWTRCDVEVAAELERALRGVDAAYFLVHAMGSGQGDFAERERQTAHQFREMASRAGVRRIIYLGGVAPSGPASVHLQSRLDVGEVLRGGAVPTLELRASMIVGAGGASWQIVRDLAMRLPVMLLPAWTASRTCPVARDDVVAALVLGLELPLPRSAWYDIPGPDTLSCRDILCRVAALRGRRVPGIRVPFLSVSLSSWWLKLVTRADFSLARELVLGFTGDLLPSDARYWAETGHTALVSFDGAARRALDEEQLNRSLRTMAGAAEEALVQLVGPKL
jgi:uncharacterized protein YbjT (DUF2867 family)